MKKHLPLFALPISGVFIEVCLAVWINKVTENPESADKAWIFWTAFVAVGVLTALKTWLIVAQIRADQKTQKSADERGDRTETAAIAGKKAAEKAVHLLEKSALQNITSSLPPPKPPKLLTQNPFKPSLFLGRDEEMDDIRKRLFEQGESPLFLSGEGGMGKTSLASAFYHRHQNLDYRHTAWVIAERSIAEALLQLAGPLDLDFDQNMTTDQRIERLFTKMGELESPALLVIDNADIIEDLIAHEQFLRLASNFHLILTTRVTELHPYPFISVGGLKADFALDVFKKHFKKLSPDEVDLFQEIREAVGHNTLVLELMAKRLAVQNRVKTHYGIGQMLEDLQKKGLFQLQTEGSESPEVSTDYRSTGGKMRYEKPEAIISAMYDLANLPASEAFLMAVFSILPTEPLDFSFLEKLLDGQPNFENDLFNLHQKGWIEMKGQPTTFRCSPVVQEVVFEKKKEVVLVECADVIERVIKGMDSREVDLINTVLLWKIIAHFNKILPSKIWEFPTGCGVVKWFSATKGFGFIGYGDGQSRDIFVHITALDGLRIDEGDIVAFDLVDSIFESAKEAINISMITKNPNPPMRRNFNNGGDRGGFTEIDRGQFNRAPRHVEDENDHDAD